MDESRCTEESLPAAEQDDTASLTADLIHEMEQEVKRRLLSAGNLQFSSLVVRRISGGVCLEGVLETDDEIEDVFRLARQVAGVEEVLNHLVVHPGSRPPAKG